VLLLRVLQLFQPLPRPIGQLVITDHAGEVMPVPRGGLVTAGVMFSDADLLGIPLRVILSPRNMKNGCCEIVSRDKSISMKVPLGEMVVSLKEKIMSEMEAFHA
jgi:hypothetical protein